MVSPHDEAGPLRLGRLGAEFTVTATDPTINPSYWARRLAAEWERWEREPTRFDHVAAPRTGDEVEPTPREFIAAMGAVSLPRRRK
jgi:hypothetical protein